MYGDNKNSSSGSSEKPANINYDSFVDFDLNFSYSASILGGWVYIKEREFAGTQKDDNSYYPIWENTYQTINPSAGLNLINPTIYVRISRNLSFGLNANYSKISREIPEDRSASFYQDSTYYYYKSGEITIKGDLGYLQISPLLRAEAPLSNRFALHVSAGPSLIFPNKFKASWKGEESTADSYTSWDGDLEGKFNTAIGGMGRLDLVYSITNNFLVKGGVTLILGSLDNIEQDWTSKESVSDNSGNTHLNKCTYHYKEKTSAFDRDSRTEESGVSISEFYREYIDCSISAIRIGISFGFSF
ncbi:MAG: hypothetical protein JXA60_05515 [Candidatus Coatesbacteria bacterium]|nr:hypothetical protein [Candidatus Coatesbacteria bacterium]